MPANEKNITFGIIIDSPLNTRHLVIKQNIEHLKPNIMIQLQSIERFFRTNFQRSYVLRDVSFDVEQGEFLTIMGPSGAGKSTLLNIIGMLDQPNSGKYHFMEKPVHQLKEKQRTRYHRNHIGFIFQAYHLIDDLTVYENIETPLLYKGIKISKRKSMVADILDRFNIVAKKDLFPNQLSGGQQQLVGVARAIVAAPRLLLADEPTGNLHSEQGKEIMELLKQLNKNGMTIIQVTHSEKQALYGKRIIRLEDGFIRSDNEVKKGILHNS